MTIIHKNSLVLCNLIVSVLCFNAEVYSQQLPELNLTESDSVLTYTGDANAGMSTSVTFKEQTLTGSYGSVKIYPNGTFDYVASAIHDSLASGSKYSEDFVFTANDDSTLSLTVVINGENDVPAISKLNYVIDASANTNLERASGFLEYRIKMPVSRLLRLKAVLLVLTVFSPFSLLVNGITLLIRVSTIYLRARSFPTRLPWYLWMAPQEILV